MPSKTVQAACDRLIQRVRYETASLRLPGSATPTPGEDTAEIREATRLYTETWIVPLLCGIRDNDLELLRRLT